MVYLFPATYFCEGGASGMDHHDDQVLSKPIQETVDDHVSDVEKDAGQGEGRMQYQLQSAEENVKKVHCENIM